MGEALRRGALLVLLAAAGCGGGQDSTVDTNDPGGGVVERPTDTAQGAADGAAGNDPGATGKGSGTGSGTGEGFAHVTAVSAAGSESAYTFSVTVESSDVDCTHFADWWEVLTPEGALVFRRILAHPHTDAISGNPFTRSGAAVNVKANQEVIVRAHLNDVGYRGKAMRGSVSAGFREATDIAGDFAAAVAAEAPQPEACVSEGGR